MRADLGRDKCWSVFSPSKNSELCTTTLTPQQANTQRVRLKICSNPKVDEGGQHPITDDHYEGLKSYDFFSLGVHLYSYSRIWMRVGKRKWNNSSHSFSVNASWSAKLKNTTNRPQFTIEKPSEWSSFNVSRFAPGRSLNFCLSSSISLEDTFNVLACVRYGEKSTRRKDRDKHTLTQNLVINKFYYFWKQSLFWMSLIIKSRSIGCSSFLTEILPFEPIWFVV